MNLEISPLRITVENVTSLHLVFIVMIVGRSDVLSIDLDNKPCKDTVEANNRKENNGCGAIIRCGSVKEAKDIDVDNSTVFPSKNKE